MILEQRDEILATHILRVTCVVTVLWHTVFLCLSLQSYHFVYVYFKLGTQVTVIHKYLKIFEYNTLLKYISTQILLKDTISRLNHTIILSNYPSNLPSGSLQHKHIILKYMITLSV